MRILLSILICFTLLVGCSTLSRKHNQHHQISTKKTVVKPPKLVVGIVVDQMRYDYLTRFYSRYTDGGFKRLMDQGFNCKNTHYNYVPTYTAPGHASIYTGTSPINHGIISNWWYDKFQDKFIYNASDNSVLPVGTDNKAGKMSPRRLLTTTVTDQLELHTQGNAKVIGISIKDRGAILPAGHAADAAYWFHGKDEGKMISSTFYIDELPQWVQDFNTSKKTDQYLQEWNTLYPIETYTASGSDRNDYEKAPNGKDTATFPYDLSTLKVENENYDLIKATPYGNSLVANFAIEALQHEQLGKDDVTDFLAISFSSTDYIGHQYGVNSVEIEDTYLRLDRDLERILNQLDAQVGNGNYTVFLTADHGAVNNPTYLQSRKIPAGYIDDKDITTDLKKAVKKEYGSDLIIENISNSQVFFNYKAIETASINKTDLQNFVAHFLTNYDRIDKVFTRHALTNANFTAGTAALIQNGFHHKRSGDVVFVLEPGVIDYSITGSTHGSSQSYDTHVPLLFYGNGIKNGASYHRTEIIDIAPTISSLLEISFPNGATGNSIQEILMD